MSTDAGRGGLYGPKATEATLNNLTKIFIVLQLVFSISLAWSAWSSGQQENEADLQGQATRRRQRRQQYRLHEDINAAIDQALAKEPTRFRRHPKCPRGQIIQLQKDLATARSERRDKDTQIADLPPLSPAPPTPPTLPWPFSKPAKPNSPPCGLNSSNSQTRVARTSPALQQAEDANAMAGKSIPHP